MGKPTFSKQKTLPGDAYVTATHHFTDLVFETCTKLPKKWRDYLLTPLFKDADRIDTDITTANKIYMDPKVLTNKQLLENLQQRMKLLDDALRIFDSFDRHFDRLMSQMDILDTDFRVMYSHVKEAIAKADPKKTLNVKIHGTDNFFSYTADIDGEVVKVHFTRNKKDQLLDAEAVAKERIGDRKSKDQRYFKSLCQKNSS